MHRNGLVKDRNSVIECMRECVFLLGGQGDAEGVGWWHQETYGGNHHVHPSRTRHLPLAALAVVLQDGFIALADHSL